MNDDTLPEEVRKAYQEAHDALEFVETKMEETTTKTPPGRAKMGQETAVVACPGPDRKNRDVCLEFSVFQLSCH